MGRVKAKPTAEQRRAIYCVMKGHSRVVEMCFGYVSCARCGQQIGDTLAGIFDVSKHVILGHGCKTCCRNVNDLRPSDTHLLPHDAVVELSKIRRAALP